MLHQRDSWVYDPHMDTKHPGVEITPLNYSHPFRSTQHGVFLCGEYWWSIIEDEDGFDCVGHSSPHTSPFETMEDCLDWIVENIDPDEE